MKNIIDIRPSTNLHGRPLYNTLVVDEQDIAGKEILDIGCGHGWFELNALKRGCKKITGLELTEKELDIARKYINKSGIEFVVGNTTNLPLESSTFDTVVSWEVMEHVCINEESRMFSEVWRVLKPGGHFYLSTPYNSLLTKLLDPAWWLIKHRHYSTQHLRGYANNNNFETEFINTNGGWWEMIGMLDLYIAKWIFKREPFFEDFINKRQDLEYSKKQGFAVLFAKLTKTK